MSIVVVSVVKDTLRWKSQDAETPEDGHCAAAPPVPDLPSPSSQFSIKSRESSVQTPSQGLHITNLSIRLTARL